jgi:formylglycine-generating enzyme required for sulfatase activity
MAVDFSLAIGMTAKTETIIETAPDNRTEHISVSVKPKTANRSLIWIGVGSLLVLCLLVFAFGTFRVLSALPVSSKSTQAPSPEVTNPPISPSPSESVGLPDTEGMVEIPSGAYEVGLTPADKYHVAPISIPLTNFLIDKYQTTNAQYQQYLNKTSEQPGEIWPGEGDHPARGVTWDQALAYCTWAGKRLPTEAEWEAAGRGPGPSPQLYPWGNDPSDGGKTFNLPDQDTYAVGTQSFNQSQFGVFDMVGNVWEWTGEPYAAVQDGYKVLRGGRFGLPQDLAYRLAVAPNDTRYVKFAGFRCAVDQVK